MARIFFRHRNGKRWDSYGWDYKLSALPFYHAWNRCPKSGRVIDATWAVGKVALYLGVELTSNQLMRIIDLTGCFVSKIAPKEAEAAMKASAR